MSVYGLPEGPHRIEREDWGDLRHGSDWIMRWQVEGIWYVVHDRYPGVLHEAQGPDSVSPHRAIYRNAEPDLYLVRMSELATTDSIWHFDGWRVLLWDLGLRSMDGKYPATKADMKGIMKRRGLGHEG